MIKEVFRNAGYRNGSRFFPQEQGDPRLAKAFQMIQQLQGQLADKRFEIQANAQIEQMKIAAQTKTKDDETRVNAARIDLDADIRNKEVAVKGKDIEAQILIALMSQEGTKEDRDLKLRALYAKAAEADLRTETERLRLSQEKERGDREATMKERESAVKESNEARISQVADGVSQVVAEVGKQVGEIKSELQEAMKTAEKVNELQEALLEMARGVNAMASSIGAIQAKPKPTGWKKQNKDGKKSIVITFDNGDSHEMTEQ
jgi:hypothetical protein